MIIIIIIKITNNNNDKMMMTLYRISIISELRVSSNLIGRAVPHMMRYKPLQAVLLVNFFPYT